MKHNNNNGGIIQLIVVFTKYPDPQIHVPGQQDHATVVPRHHLICLLCLLALSSTSS